MGAVLLGAVVGAIVSAIVTVYLQKRVMRDPAGEVTALRKQLQEHASSFEKQVAAVSEQFAEFKQSVETKEREQAEFEHFPLAFTLQQGSPGSYNGTVRNESKHKVAIETIQILRGDTNHESPLTEAVKPRKADEWMLEPGTGKSFFWAPQNDPASMLRSLVNSPDPNFPSGSVIPIVLVLTVRVDGNRVIKKRYIQQVCFQGNQILPWGPDTT